MICDPGDVVVVPFPFSDISVAKARPTVVVSSSASNQGEGETLLAMITTAAASERPGDVRLDDWARAGLKSSCVVRTKIFTLDNRLIARRIGLLSDGDRTVVSRAINALIGI